MSKQQIQNLKEYVKRQQEELQFLITRKIFHENAEGSNHKKPVKAENLYKRVAKGPVIES